MTASELTKNSGIETLLPPEWKTVRLKHVGRIRYGLGQPPREMDGGIPFLRATNIDRGRIVRKGLVYVDPEEVPMGREAFLRAGEILVVRSGAYTGDSAIVPAEYDGAVAGYDMVFSTTDADPRYVAYCLLSSAVLTDQIDLARLRAAQPHLNAEDLGACLVSLPPREEQSRLVRLLDSKTADLDEVIETKQRMRDLLREKRQALAMRLVTRGLDFYIPLKDSGLSWLGKIPQHWELKPLGYSVDVVGGATPSKENPAFWDGGVPWMSPKDMKPNELTDSEDHITKEALAETSLTLINPPAVLMVIRGMILIHTVPIALTKVAVTINQDLKALLPKPHYSARYLAHLLRAANPALLALIEQAGHGTRCLRTESWTKLRLPVPPLSEQHAISDLLDDESRDIESAVSKLDEQMAKLHEYRQALITAAVTGKLDVRRKTAV